eukprot:CAMPEP_0115735834 /NCGR_PEP_ID=MMETSP0272-20121206/86937_1 /TAXON_ID=71861 /ORGANISM="Scrippsiella trochoidea, Strain CCMP3099" /LENGTH=154 /DNA_ID=CAMNT_0003179979 /DNA_START=366 /DNA_END=831 /DNA_ORIENTATION=+
MWHSEHILAIDLSCDCAAIHPHERVDFGTEDPPAPMRAAAEAEAGTRGDQTTLLCARIIQVHGQGPDSSAEGLGVRGAAFGPLNWIVCQHLPVLCVLPSLPGKKAADLKNLGLKCPTAAVLQLETLQTSEAEVLGLTLRREREKRSMGTLKPVK